MLQAFLLGLCGAYGHLDWGIGTPYLNRPIILGPLVGLILGDFTTGIVIGATLEVFFLGQMAIGSYIPPDAAVGGVLAASLTKELLHAGFESASTARLVNIALALKSDDESAVALDALSIDLYTGDAVLYKAGAAASFLLRDGKAAVYSGDTLPIGILGSVTGRRELLCLSPGDTAVLVSDGALAPGASWLRAQLVAHADDAPQKLADAVARAAREKQQDMPDDVTVMALRLRAVE